MHVPATPTQTHKVWSQRPNNASLILQSAKSLTIMKFIFANIGQQQKIYNINKKIIKWQY